MAPPAQARWELGHVRLPKLLDDEPTRRRLEALLSAGAHELWSGSTLCVPSLSWSPALGTALATAARAAHLGQGLDAAEKALANEARGLSMADARSRAERGVRVSRLLLLSNDGAQRFYRRVERLLLTHGERVLALRLDVGSSSLAEVIGHPGVVRALLIENKQSVAGLLLALAAGPEAGG